MYEEDGEEWEEGEDEEILKRYCHFGLLLYHHATYSSDPTQYAMCLKRCHVSFFVKFF
jgi:hypothetical protein